MIHILLKMSLINKKLLQIQHAHQIQQEVTEGILRVS
jgi:hypothetical protein